MSATLSGMTRPLRFAALATLFLSSSFLFAQDSVTTAVQQVIVQQTAAWNRHDLDGFMAGYWNSSDLTFFSGASESNGWDAALARYRKSYQGDGHDMGSLEFSNLRIEPLSKDSAFVRGAWKLTLADGKTPHGLFTLVFRKFPEGWKIIHDHTSSAE
jgi:ketosteroid isomerase-like protein